MVFHSILLGFGSFYHGPGWDECAHLPAGISHWQLGNTDLYRVNPPLVRLLATIPLINLDTNVTWEWDREQTLYRPEWDIGRQFFHKNGRRAYFYLMLARFMCIPWSLLAIYMIFRWGTELYGEYGGIFSSTLWCFSPLVLANAQMITPDTAASALGITASFAFRRWLCSRELRVAILCGFVLGFTQLTKFTWVVLFVWWPVLVACLQAFQFRRFGLQRVRRDTCQFVVLIATSLFIINAGYGFEGTCCRLGDYGFVSRLLSGNANSLEQTLQPGNRFRGTLIGAVPVPLPKNYLLGIDRQKLDFESNFQSYLRGQWRNHGWWYYYFYAVTVKEPVGYLILLVATAVLSFRRGFIESRSVNWDQYFLLAPAVIVFGLVSSQTGFNHHLRYLLPAFPFVFVWMGGLWTEVRANIFAQALVSILLGLSIASSLWVYPCNHAYFNVIAGGPANGHEHLLDSNVDWGQDILCLSRWISANRDRPLDGVAYSLDSLIDRKALGVPAAKPPPGQLEQNFGFATRESFGPQAGRYAVFVRPLREHDRRYEYFLDFTPIERIGYTIHIYEISTSDVEQYWDKRSN